MTKKKQAKHNFKKIIIGALIAFFAAILIFILFINILYYVEVKQNKDSNKKVLPLFNAYIIISPSMSPTINVQDAVVVMRVDPKKLKKNDIITFVSSNNKYGGLTVTHRIVGIKKENNKLLFKTKGDNNYALDFGYVDSKDIYGKVIFKIPKLGYIQKFLNNAYGWILLVLLPCIVVIIFDVVMLSKMIKKKIKVKNTKKIDYDSLITKIEPICKIDKNNNTIYYYDLKSAVEFANKEDTDTTITMLVESYILPERVEIRNIYQRRITLTSTNKCTIYKNSVDAIIVITGELMLDKVVLQDKKK